MNEARFRLLIAIAGTEQHRHNTAEVAVYSIISYLWGLETRGHYAMTKVSDVGVDSGIAFPVSKGKFSYCFVSQRVHAESSHVFMCMFPVRLEALHKLK